MIFRPSVDSHSLAVNGQSTCDVHARGLGLQAQPASHSISPRSAHNPSTPKHCHDDDRHGQPGGGKAGRRQRGHWLRRRNEALSGQRSVDASGAERVVRSRVAQVDGGVDDRCSEGDSIRGRIVVWLSGLQTRLEVEEQRR